jgi:oligopeptide/dipeptide ABC transporter ATP-binding protein
MSEPLLIETRNLCKHFSAGGWLGGGKRVVRALDDVNLSIQQQETLGVVGESGCGKTTLGRVLLRLIEPTAGQILFEGRDIVPLKGEDLRRQARDMQIVFQNPYSSFDPRFSVRMSLAEPLQTHQGLQGAALEERASELLTQVGMPVDTLSRYPHEFSGGQLQRIAVARALALNPKFIVLDEPTSALDVSVQAQILNLLQDLQQRLNLTYLFISHDLSVVEYISSRIAVMYLGKVVELLPTALVSAGQAQHPYTQALLSAIPEVSAERRHKRTLLPKSVFEGKAQAGGCSFAPRCPFAMDVCRAVEPPLVELETGHLSACHLANEMQ